MKALTLRWHRQLAWLAGVAILLWTSSGLLHPLMSWTNPQAAVSKPPSEVLPTLASGDLQALLQRNGIPRLTGLRWVLLDGEVTMQVSQPDTALRRYLSWPEGVERVGGDAKRAQWLARYYAGEPSAMIAQTTLVTAFDLAYPPVNRLLPVWRVQFDRPDHLSVYVDTGSDRTSAINDARKECLLAIFLTVHKLHFLQQSEGGRVAIIGTFVMAALSMGVLGLGMLALLRRRQQARGTRALHRVLAHIVWVPLLMFSASGIFHLLTFTTLRKSDSDGRLPAIEVSALKTLPASRGLTGLGLLPLASEQAWWAYRTDDAMAYRMAVPAKPVTINEAAFARALAQKHGLSQQDLVAQNLITGFTDEYGFVNKRLPVWRMQSRDGTLLFVDTRGGVLAATMGRTDLAEGWSFSNLHKWQFLHGLGRPVRDGIMVFFASLLIMATGAGLTLRLRRK